MALRETLPPPLVVDPVEPHTHTVIFLHRFPESTTDDELRSKVLSSKMTRNHKTLQEQLPTVRWVFPYAKSHARHWSNLSAADKASLGLTTGSGATTTTPYITQIILQESERAGGLHRIVLGGQGETAEAAHDAMASFPEIFSRAQLLPAEDNNNNNKVEVMLRVLSGGSSTSIDQLRLAGFVGMHADGGAITGDVRALGAVSKEQGSGENAAMGVNRAIVRNTPHRFIRGGYKLQTTTWDGKRIDDFAEFLVAIGVYRRNYDGENDTKTRGLNELLTPKHRPVKQQNDFKRDERDEKKRYADELIKQKAASEKEKDKILQRIEADKVERKIRQAREREARFHRAEAAAAAFTNGMPAVGGEVRVLGSGLSAHTAVPPPTTSLQPDYMLGVVKTERDL